MQDCLWSMVYTMLLKEYDLLANFTKLHYRKCFLSETVSASVQQLSHVWLFMIPWTIAYQAPLSMESYRQECSSGLPFPTPWDCPNPGIKPTSWSALTFSTPGDPRGSSQSRDQTQVSWASCIGTWILDYCATWEAPTVSEIQLNFNFLKNHLRNKA